MPVLKALHVDVFFGDSNSDIKAALDAGAYPVRVQRSTASSYTYSYTPGKYGELVLANTAD